MNVLIFAYNYEDNKSNSCLQNDLIRIFEKRGHSVYVVSMSSEKNIKYTSGDVKLLKISTGSQYNISPLRKFLNLFINPIKYYKGYLKYFADVKIDIIIGYAPYNANCSLVKKIKKRHKSLSFLMIWDFFPDNARDLGVIKSKILYHMLKLKEKLIYKAYDVLVCNSQGGIDYLEDNYKFSNKDKILIRNCEKLKELQNTMNKEEIMAYYGIKEDDLLFIYGGNIGIAQQLENLIDATKLIKEKKLKILIIGYGTEKSYISDMLIKYKEKRVKVLDSIARDDYETLLSIATGGIICLNKNFKVPNAPTKLTAYLKHGLPVFAILDEFTSRDMGSFIDSRNIGVWARAQDLKGVSEKFNEFITNSKNSIYKRKEIRKVYETEFNIELAYKKIMDVWRSKNV